MRVRLVLHALAVALVLVTAGVARAESIPEQTITAATEAGLDPVDVQGAANTVGADAWTYLYGTGELQRPVPIVSALALARVRLTYYNESGLTASGGRTYPGSTACSYNWRFGTRFRFPNGEIVTCNDRGRLGSSGWLDVYRRPDLARAYGPYVTVEVLAG